MCVVQRVYTVSLKCFNKSISFDNIIHDVTPANLVGSMKSLQYQTKATAARSNRQ